MARLKTKTNAFDWALIQWARACEERVPVDETETRELERSLDAERDANGRLVDPLAYLTLRGEKIIESRGASSRRWLARGVRIWLFSLVVAACLGAIVFPFSRVNTLLDAGVNLAGPFVFFLLGQLFFLFASLVMAAALVAQGLIRLVVGKERPMSKGERFVQFLSGFVGGVVIGTIRKTAPLFFRLFGGASSERFAWRSRRSRRKDSEEEPTSDYRDKDDKSLSRKCGAQFWDALFSRPRFLFLWGGLLSHAFWVSCSLCVLVILVARMQGNRYDYCWRTSLEDERIVKKFVDVLGAPVVAIGIDAPTQEDVDRLFADFWSDLNESKDAPDKSIDATSTARSRAQTRARWSYFLLGLVFVWCVVPRAFLIAVYYCLMRLALRDFRPKLDDPYFQEILSRAEAERATVASSYVDAPDDSSFDEREPIDAPSLPIWRSESPAAISIASEGTEDVETIKIDPGADVKDVSIELASDVVAPVPDREAPLREKLARATSIDEDALDYRPPAPRIALAFGYDASLSEEFWREALGDARPTTILGDVAESSGRRALEDVLRKRSGEIALCAMITDVGLPPARHFVKFVRDLLTPALSESVVYVILSGGERLRQKYATSPTAVAERVEDWTKSIQFISRASNVPFHCVFYYDAELDLAEPRARLFEELRAAASGKSSALGEVKRDLKKWDAATKLILDECRAIWTDDDFVSSEEADRLRVASVCDGIFKIYREEFARAIYDGKTGLRERLGDAAGSVLSKLSTARAFGGDAEDETGFATTASAVGRELSTRLAGRGFSRENLERRLTATLGLSDKMREFCKKLSPKSALAAASVGFSVPALVACAPLLGGALTATAVASTIGALTAALPASFATGAFAGALGATIPASAGALKRKISEKFRGTFSRDARANTSATEDVAPSDSDEWKSRAESSATLALACATWSVVLELQGLSEDEIVDQTPLALAPLEDSELDSVETIEEAFNATRDILLRAPKISRR